MSAIRTTAVLFRYPIFSNRNPPKDGPMNALMKQSICFNQKIINRKF